MNKKFGVSFKIPLAVLRRLAVRPARPATSSAPVSSGHGENGYLYPSPVCGRRDGNEGRRLDIDVLKGAFEIMTSPLPALFLCAALIIVSFFLYFHFIDVPPTDDALISDFYRHRSSYAALHRLLLEETPGITISKSGIQKGDAIEAIKPPDGNFPLARYARYVDLLNQIGAISAYYYIYPKEDPEICAEVWARPSEHLRVCWLDRPPAPDELVPENSKPRPWYQGKPNFLMERKYRHIEGNWYRQYN